MAYPRGWRLSYAKELDNISQQPLYAILERRDKQEFLRFQPGVIAELNSYDFSLIKDNLVKIADIFCCLGVYTSLTYDSLLQAYPSYLVTVTECHLVGKLPDYEVYRITGVHFLCLNKPFMEDDYNNEVVVL